MRSIVCFSLLSLLLCANTCPALSAGSVLEPADLVNMVMLVPDSTAISPDGKYVAYTDMKPGKRKQLLVVTIASGVTRLIGDPGADNWQPVWSPDSKQLAFFSRRGAAAHVALWNAATDRVRTMREVVAAPLSVPAVWLPDSRHLMLEALTLPEIDALLHPAHNTAPTPDVSVLLTTPQPGITENSHRITTGGTIVDGMPETNMVSIDTATGTSSVLIPHFRSFSPYTYTVLSPDRRHLLYFTERGAVNSDTTSRDLFDVDVLDLKSRISRTIVRNVLSSLTAQSFSWSHDGSKIAFVGGVVPTDMDVPAKDYNVNFPGHAYVVNVQTGAIRRLGDCLLRRGQGPLLWSRDDSTIYAVDEENAEHVTLYAVSVTTGVAHPIFNLDGEVTDMPKLINTFGSHHYVQAIAANGERRIYDIDLSGATPRIVYHAYQGIRTLTFSANGTRTAYIGEAPNHPPDVWVTENGFRAAHQVTHLNPQIDKRALGTAENVRWTSKSGIHLQGTVLLPAGYVAGKRYPLVTWIYGGEPIGTWGRGIFGVGNAFGEDMLPHTNLQLLASRGYAVFVPNTVLHVGTPLRDLGDEVLPGIDAVIARGIADPHRLGLLGVSYGGYSTLSLLVQSTRFKAAVAMVGISDLFVSYGTLFDNGGDWSFWAETGQGRMGSTPWTNRQRYLDNSPFFFLDKIHTPILLEYGTNDRLSTVNMDEVFVGLRRLNRTAELVKYNGEGHGIDKPSNQIDFANRLIAWFNKYLKSEGHTP